MQKQHRKLPKQHEIHVGVAAERAGKAAREAVFTICSRGSSNGKAAQKAVKA